MIKLSICISTWNRKNDLKKLIYELENQTLERKYYEIIVCDSNSSDGTKEVMKILMTKYQNIKYVNTEKNILAAKRNLGLFYSKGEIVIFLDDDIVPLKNFLESHLRAHEHETNKIFCGKVQFPNKLVASSNYYRFRNDAHRNSGYKELPFNRIVVMNMSFKKKEFLNEIHSLNEKFTHYGCEDIELGYRISLSKLKLYYLDTAEVIHYEKSKNIVEYSKKIYNAGKYGECILESINPKIIKELKSRKILENRIIYRIVSNKFFNKILEKYLLCTDKINFLYSYMLYRLYLGHYYLRGIENQNFDDIALKETSTGWSN